VGLIITRHMYVHPSGKAHPEMTGVYSDDLIPSLAELAGGFRSRSVMEERLASGDADFVSLCRPLICEPDLPNRLRDGTQERSSCISGNRCWPQSENEGIACKCLDKATPP
jgi:2,4-dienoyl-CoA reductase-like NADH-dependent reductase (Old Yellow Enzyme family)